MHKISPSSITAAATTTTTVLSTNENNLKDDTFLEETRGKTK
jgi:hypothetical protein